MADLTPIFSEPGLVLSVDKSKTWIYANGRKWGVLTAPGKLYCYRRDVEAFRKERGFHIPKPFLGYEITFEVKMKDSYSTWLYTNKGKQRMLPTVPLIFVSLARLEWKKDAEHVTRPK